MFASLIFDNDIRKWRAATAAEDAAFIPRVASPEEIVADDAECRAGLRGQRVKKYLGRRRQREADRPWREQIRRHHTRLDRTAEQVAEDNAAERAADDADHAAWLASGAPDLLAELRAKRVAQREAAEAQRDAIDKTHRAICMAADSTEAQVEDADAQHEIAIGYWKKRHDHLWPRREFLMSSILPFPAPPASRKLILSDAEFVANFEPPEYLLDGILQRRYCYALTAQTGAGKTAVALRIAAHVGLGRKLGDRDVAQGAILYFASENSVDVQARWIAMAQHCNFEIGKTNVRFVAGATRLSEIAAQITAEAAQMDDLALVVVDTSAATFEGEDENSNVAAIEHAKRMRSLTELRGGPTVLVLCHPTKRATADDLLPRGGGSFLAEIDGNLCARKSDSAVEISWCGKFRGPDFAPLHFELRTVTAEALRDKRGRSMPTVIAEPIDEAGRAAVAAAGRRDEDVVLRAIEAQPGASSNELAKAIGWQMRDGRPYGIKVRRAAERLAGDGLIQKHRGSWMLSRDGERELNRADRNAPKM